MSIDCAKSSVLTVGSQQVVPGPVFGFALTGGPAAMADPRSSRFQAIARACAQGDVVSPPELIIALNDAVLDVNSLQLG